MKKLIAFLLSAIMVLSLCACATDGPAADETTVAETEAETSPFADHKVEYPTTVIDHLGREVTFDKPAEKLVSGYYISTSILIGLGLEDKLVGIEAKADTRNIYKIAAEEIISLPSVGTAKNFDLETCAALSPDLVIIPVKLSSVIEQLEALGIKVLAINPESTDSLIQTIIMLSRATGTLARGVRMVDDYQRGIASISKRLAKVEESPKVYLAGNSSFLSTAGSAMYQNALIENAGCENVAKELTDTYWAEVSYEQILTWNPEYIIIASNADYTVESVLEDKNLSECDAVKNGNVYQIPSTYEDWDSPVPSSFLGSIWLAATIHKDNYSMVEFNKYMKDFYDIHYEFEAENF